MGSQGHHEEPAHMGVNFTPTIHHDTYSTIDTSKSLYMEGKHVFITGSSRGVGKAMAVAYAKAGASIIGLAARSKLEEVKKECEEAAVSVGRETPKIVTVSMDILSPESVQKAADIIDAEFDGRLDILISNAGYMETWRPIINADIDDWWRSWEINIKGQFLVWKSLIPLLLADESSLKTVINISSIGAQMVVPTASAYQTTKFAINRLTEFLNEEYGDKGLVAYCMHPGAVPTELAWKMPDKVKLNLIDTPELMANTVVYLTQKKREWLAGRYLMCNWDMEEFFGMRDEIVERDLLKMRMQV